MRGLLHRARQLTSPFARENGRVHRCLSPTGTRCIVLAMKPNEKNIVKSLIAVAWADGKLQAPEQSMIDGLLWAFEADGDDEKELQEYAKKKRTLDQDMALDELGDGDKELLLAHAALLTHADGKQTKAEVKLLGEIVKRVGLADDQAKRIIEEAKSRAARLAERLG